MSPSRVHTPQSVPQHLAGQWVAWTPNGLYILGAGNTPEEARKAAQAHGPDPAAGWVPGMAVAYEWVPPADERFIGPVCA